MKQILRWCYKTIHFELKKEGLLGGNYLDDAEIEETLNEYGMAGWELVSLMNIHDGVLAIFKQPIDMGGAHVEVSTKEIIKTIVNDPSDAPAEPLEINSYTQPQEPIEESIYHDELPENDLFDDEKDDDDDDGGVGVIRIE
jgi:hypothetical protein